MLSHLAVTWSANAPHQIHNKTRGPAKIGRKTLPTSLTASPVYTLHWSPGPFNIAKYTGTHVLHP